LGEALLDLQHGASIGMPMSRPMPEIAAGVCELRVKDRSGIYRAFYATKIGTTLLVFHAFVKKAQKTPPHEIALARRRLKEMSE
jgi:phage-related protein